MFSNLHCHRDIFGKPGEGFHKSRLFGLARNDLLGTALVGVIIGLVSGCAGIGLMSFLIIWAIGILAHIVFGVATPVSVPVAKVLDINLADLRGCETSTATPISG